MSEQSLTEFLPCYFCACELEKARKPTGKVVAKSLKVNTIAFHYPAPPQSRIAQAAVHRGPLEPCFRCLLPWHGSLTAPENFCWRVGASLASPPFAFCQLSAPQPRSAGPTLTLFKAFPCPCPLFSPQSLHITFHRLGLLSLLP